jgi:hypothetical protein
MGRGLQRALNVGPWRENALMVGMTTFAHLVLRPRVARERMLASPIPTFPGQVQRHRSA